MQAAHINPVGILRWGEAFDIHSAPGNTYRGSWLSGVF